MISELTFAKTLDELDLGPLSVEIEKLEPPGGADAYLSLVWEGDPVRFVAEFKDARDRRTLQNAVRRARQWAEGTNREAVPEPGLASKPSAKSRRRSSAAAGP